MQNRISFIILHSALECAFTVRAGFPLQNPLSRRSSAAVFLC
jgi:hypothetical protein